MVLASGSGVRGAGHRELLGNRVPIQERPQSAADQPTQRAVFGSRQNTEAPVVVGFETDGQAMLFHRSSPVLCRPHRSRVYPIPSANSRVVGGRGRNPTLSAPGLAVFGFRCREPLRPCPPQAALRVDQGREGANIDGAAAVVASTCAPWPTSTRRPTPRADRSCTGVDRVAEVCGRGGRASRRRAHRRGGRTGGRGRR